MRVLRIDPRGDVLDGTAPESPPDHRAAAGDDLEVWLEREGPALPNDAIILERLSLAVRLRHGRGREPDDIRRDLGRLVAEQVPEEERLVSATSLGLMPSGRYRVAVAPLFAIWRDHPRVPEDVIPTRFGPVHTLVLGHDQQAPSAAPCGLGVATGPSELHHSFRTALVALRLCEPPDVPLVNAEEYGGLVDLLADAPEDSPQPDATRLDVIAHHPWGIATVDAILRAPSMRQAARLAGVHHSTLQGRVDVIAEELGFDPYEGFGRTRLGTAYVVWRLRHSRVLDLPASSAPGRT